MVSVIIPVYQVSDYIERCIRSVMAQSYTDIECVIVDDATRDDSIVKCEGLINEYDGPIRFRILHHDMNLGLSAARNTGTDAATGEYIYYLDSDDDITPDCIEKLVACTLEDDAIEMVQGNYVKTGDGDDYDGGSVDHRIKTNDDARYQFLQLRRLNYTVWNKLLKRAFVIENRLYNKEGIINEDLLWTFHLIKYLSNACLCKEVTYHYLIRPGSIRTSESMKKMGQSYAIIYDEMLHCLTPGKEKGELKGLLPTFCAMLASYYRCAPEMKPVVRLYKRQARRYGCWPAYLTLVVIAPVCRFGNPSGILMRLNHLRLKLMK